jgi:uncharacterized protein YndB with AHSA1/START domain
MNSEHDLLAGAPEHRDESVVIDIEQSIRVAERRTAVCVTRSFRTSPKHVFDAWLDPEIAGKWLFATASHPMTQVTISARVGGSFRLVERRDGRVCRFTGRYIEIVPNRRLAFSLRLSGRRAVTRVVVDILPLKKGCQLSVNHRDLPAGCVDYAEQRWTGILYGLDATLRADVEFAVRRTTT